MPYRNPASCDVILYKRVLGLHFIPMIPVISVIPVAPVVRVEIQVCID